MEPEEKKKEASFGDSLSHFCCECNEDVAFCGADLSQMTEVSLADGQDYLCVVCDDLECSDLVCECGVPFRGK